MVDQWFDVRHIKLKVNELRSGFLLIKVDDEENVFMGKFLKH